MGIDLEAVYKRALAFLKSKEADGVQDRALESFAKRDLKMEEVKPKSKPKIKLKRIYFKGEGKLTLGE